ncbi:FxsA family protein [Celeribacter sp.]|uniref:FxsA family protein n=1 Tax=Celeribacter sp. TaxID=1890673 RepID=UPI003A8E5045
MWLFALFVAVPIIEIALFIQVGGFIGLWPTLLIVIVTAILGTAMVRQQGALAMTQIRSSFSNLNDPREPLAHGAMILLSGALLLTPGFFTDALGFALLIPPVRTAFYRWMSKRIKVQSFTVNQGAYRTQDPFGAHPDHGPNPSRGSTIDGEWEEIREDDDYQGSGAAGTSGWTKH